MFATGDGCGDDMAADARGGGQVVRNDMRSPMPGKSLDMPGEFPRMVLSINTFFHAMKTPAVTESSRSAGTVSVKLDPADRERIAVLASIKKRTAHYLMKEAIHEYLQREESRLNFMRAAEAAAQEFKDTGMHVTHEELDAWMETWGTENEKPMPVCHT